MNRPVASVKVVTVYFGREADALYLTLDEASATESEEIPPEIIIDSNDKSEVGGIEMRYLSKRVPGLNPRALEFETV